MDIKTAIDSWLQIRYVAQARPNDEAAKKTYDFFQTILTEDFGVTELSVRPYEEEEAYLTVDYVVAGEKASLTLDRERIEQLLADIEANPKYQ